ncbi:MAG: TolC family protein [Pseudomonadota bacterium]
MPRLPLLHVGLLTVLFTSSGIVDAEPTMIRVGVVHDEPSVWMSDAVLQLRRELSELGADEFVFTVGGSMEKVSTGQRADINADLTSLSEREDVDVIVALGPVGSDVILELPLRKPTIASAVIAPSVQGFPATEEGTSGVDNLHYLSANIDLLDALRRFKSGTQAERIAVAVDKTTRDGVPAIARSLESLVAREQPSFSIFTIDYAGAADLKSVLPEGTDAVFMLPQMARTDAQRARQVNDALEMKLPVLSTTGGDDADAGFLYSIALIPSATQLAKRLALDIRDIALGRNPADLLVALTPRDRLTVNLGTARVIDANVPFDVLFEANAIGELQASAEVFSLTDVIEESLQANLDLAVAQEDLLSAYEDTKISRSTLLPQLSAGVDWEAFDDDLAIIPEFIPSETTTASISLSQSIYSETAVSNYRSTRFLQDAEEAGFAATKLDVVEATSNAYLNVLIAKTELDIQRDNIRLTRANLERAQFRYRVGSADRSEVYRFETVLASDLQAVAAALASFQQSRFALNQLLRRPISSAFGVEETSIDSPAVFGDERLGPYISGPNNERRFADFLTAEAFENSPELDELDAQILSQDRLLLAAKRRRYVPTIDLVGSVEEVIDNDGASMPRDYNEDWQVAIELSLPLYEGDAIAARKRQARVQLRRLTLLRTQTELRLETESRNAVAAASASRLSIGFARESEKAARQTLALVTDSYTRGRSNYIDLIDAQSSYLTERLAAANASYEYLLDLVALQRAIGFFDYAASDQTRDDWFNRLETFAENTP